MWRAPWHFAMLRPVALVSTACCLLFLKVPGETLTGQHEAPSKGTSRAPAQGGFLMVEPFTADFVVHVNDKDGQKYVYIAAGQFRMGCSPTDNQCDSDEKPTHDVTISKGFWLGQTPVTLGAWRRYRKASDTHAMAANDDDPFQEKTNGNDDDPAAGVAWEDAKAYCEWIGGRLPTEAEWEYAARAGNDHARYGDLDAIAWYADNSGERRIESSTILRTDEANYVRRLVKNYNRLHPVAQKLPNSWNLYDMLGNVWEWTADLYGERYYAETASRDPKGPTNGERHVLRGGSFDSPPSAVRVSQRSSGWLYSREDDLGWRCVQESLGTSK